MKTHGNAGLTVAQRESIQKLYREGKAKKSQLAARFQVNRKTIDRWVKRSDGQDHPSGPKHPRKVVTPAYRQAVIAHRQAHPDHGPITIAFHLQKQFAFANRGTVQRILQQEKLSQAKDKPPKKQNR